MEKNVVRFGLAGILLASSLSTIADDRSGVYLSGGLGLQRTSLTLSQNGNEADDSFGGISTSFKLGGYVNQNLALYYQMEQSVFADDSLYDSDSSYLVLSRLMGLGGTYYLSDQGGAYVEAGLGLGNISHAAVDAFKGLGQAFMVGVGYETSPHTQVGGLIQYVKAEDKDDSSFEAGAFSFGIKAELKL